MLHLYSWIVSLVAMIAIDGCWIGLFMGTFFRTHVGHLMRATPLLSGALVAYLCMHTSLYYLVILPTQQLDLLTAAGRGAFFGLCLFGTYELTNYATLADWPLKLVVVDVAWGAFLCALVTAITHRFS